MSYYGAELHKFITGDIRTDGWRSDWRLDLERRMAEEALKPRPVVKAAQIKARQEKKKYPRQHPNSYYFTRECTVCGTKIRKDNKTGRCIKHKLKRPQALAAITYKCGACDKPIRKTEYGVCKPCFTRYRRRIQQNRPRCAQCNTIIRSKTKYGLCREHARPLHNKHEAAMKKMRRAELRKAQ